MQHITIEQVEALATQLEADEQAEREKLDRLIKAYARILAKREPSRFQRQALEQADEDGHFDNSYPPKVEYRNFSGPRLLCVRDNETRDVATSGGFYYDWKRVTEDFGLWVSRDGTIYGCDETGTGAVGRFAAHPGDHNVQVELDWSPRGEVSLAELRVVEANLRALAFPLSQGAAA